MSAPEPRDEPFTPHDVTWSSVSPRLALARRVTLTLTLGLLAAVAVVVGLVLADSAWTWLVLLGLAVAEVWGWLLAGWQASAIGYAERADDLLVRRGVMNRNLVVEVPPWLLALAAGAGLAGAALGWVLVDRNVRRWGYAERDEDLYITHGALNRRLVVVPYGRMQYVDVQAGPLDRAFGIAQVQLHTASSGTDASIPGLPPHEAARLRDRLASRGQAQLAGL